MEYTLELSTRALYLILQMSLPPIIVASIVGILVSLFQAITQLQEQTLSFAFKLVSITFTVLVLMGWLTGGLYSYTETIFSNFYLLVG